MQCYDMGVIMVDIHVKTPIDTHANVRDIHYTLTV